MRIWLYLEWFAVLFSTCLRMSSSDRKNIVIASRASALAMLQAELMKKELEMAHPSFSFSIESFSTTGDRIQNLSLHKIGAVGLFTKELEVALLDQRADLAVHSLKDMPSTLPPGLLLGAITKREDSSDAVIMHQKHKDKTLDSLPAGSCIGTSSLRRVAQLKHAYPQYIFKSVRGNVQTRLRKLDNFEEFQYDALIMATAGLTRMGLADRIHETLSTDVCTPAVGQGALAVECRENDSLILQLLESVNHKRTEICCSAERAFMRVLEGGCQVPIGVLSCMDDSNSLLELQAIVLNLEGSKSVKGIHSKPNCTSVPSAIELGEELAHIMIKKGAKEVLNEMHNQ